jgi:hypothetical protein
VNDFQLASLINKRPLDHADYFNNRLLGYGDHVDYFDSSLLGYGDHAD